MGKSVKTGNTASSGSNTAGDSSTQRDAYISAYIQSVYNGGTQDEATAAARETAMPEISSALTGSATDSAGRYADRVMGKTQLSSAEQRYSDRVSQTTAQNHWNESGQKYSPTWKAESEERQDSNTVDVLNAVIQEQEADRDKDGIDYLKGKLKGMIGGVTTVNVQPKSSETEDIPFTESESYQYPEKGNGLYHFTKNQPYSEEEKAFIDRLNETAAAGDEEETQRLLDLYSEGQQGREKLEYTDTLPEGADEYQPLDDAFLSGNTTQYASVREDMLNSGYDGEEIADHTAEQIRAAYTGQGESKISMEEAEKQLREYAGLSDSDAHATTAWWWFDCYGGKTEADTNGNGKLTMDELGIYCTELLDDEEIDEEQASAIFDKAKSAKSKKTYSEWLSGYRKGA